MRAIIFFIASLYIYPLFGMNKSSDSIIDQDNEMKYVTKVAQLIPELFDLSAQRRPEIKAFVTKYMDTIITNARKNHSEQMPSEIDSEFEKALNSPPVKALESQKDEFIAQVREANKKKSPRKAEITTAVTKKQDN